MNQSIVRTITAGILLLFAVSVAAEDAPRINLQNTEIRSLVEAVSKITSRNFVIDPAVRGNITFISGRGLDEDELYEAFLSILQVHGLEAIEAGNIVKIVPLNKARSQVAPIVQSDRNLEVDETVTQVFKLQYIPVTTAIQTLQPLAGQGETRIQFNQSSNSVIVTGRGQNVERLGEVISSIDQPNSNGFELVSLKHSVASQLAQTLRGLMTNGKTAGGGAIPQQVFVSVDERTNSIVISGNKQDRERMRAVIAKLDIPRTQPSETQVVPLKYAVASQLLTTLKSLQVVPAQGGAPAPNRAQIAVDERTNSILVSGNLAGREPILSAIRKLDIPKSNSGGTRVIALKYADAENLAGVLREAANSIQKQTEGTEAASGAAAGNNANAGGNSNISILADKSTNSVIISAPQHIQASLNQVIKELDRRRAQVMVEAIIAEVSTDLSNQLGFGIASGGTQSDNNGLVGISNFGGLGSLLSGYTAVTTGSGSLPGGLLLGGASNNFGLVLEALRGDGATNILSTPTLVTLDNEEASIVVGQNVPFLTGSYTSGNSSADNPFQTIQREDVGLTLKVTPQINRDKTIRLKIEQEVSSIATSSSASDLITNKRSLATNVMVEDGQVLVLGGLIQDDFRDSESKVPVLSDIPIIGKAFQQNNTAKTKQNLMAFIHPVIMPDRHAADSYTRQKYSTLQKQQARSKVLNRGGLNGKAAIFPDLNCTSGNCVKGSADDLHFNDQFVRSGRVKPQTVTHETPEQRRARIHREIFSEGNDR